MSFIPELKEAPAEVKTEKGIQPVDIDTKGTFEYILIDLLPNEESNPDAEPMTLVRGGAKSLYHIDILIKFNLEEMDKSSGLKGRYDAHCKGGGSISIDEKEKTVTIFGKSQTFGNADHEIAQKLVQKAMPDYTVDFIASPE